MGAVIIIEKRFFHAKMLNITGAIYTFFAVVSASVLFLGGDLLYSAKYIIAMLGGNRNLADSVSLYLLKSYFIVLLVCMYASTDLLRNVGVRLSKTRIRYVFEAVTPIIMLIILFVCTALISFSGSSETMLIML